MANLIETFRLLLDGKLLVDYSYCLPTRSNANMILESSMDQFGHDHEFTKLVIDLKGKDPDDAFSSIPYEKVYTLLSPYITRC